MEAAERCRTFFRRFLRHSKGQWASKPFELLDWQWDKVVAPLFGWKRADGTRRFRRGYIEVPKKNGKSTLFAGLSLYLLTCDSEPGAEIYSAAVDRDQASIVFNEAANMVEGSPHLSSRLSVVRSTKRIVDHRSRSFYQALSADVPAKEGLNAHAVLIDELHAQKTRDLWDTLRYAGARAGSRCICRLPRPASTATRSAGSSTTMRSKVLDGTVQDPAFFAYIAAAEDEDDWTDPDVWRESQPQLRHHDRRRAVRRRLPGSAGITCQGKLVPPLPAEPVDRAGRALAEHGEVGRLRRERCPIWPDESCYAGLDLSSTTDSRRWCWSFPMRRLLGAAVLLGARGRRSTARAAGSCAVRAVDSRRITSRPRRAR